MNEAIENYKNSSDQRKKSITDYFKLKRLSAASLFLHNHFQRNPNNNNNNQQDTKLNRDGSNSSLEKNSLRMNINSMKNTDQLKLIRSLSQISNLANYEYDPVKGGHVTATKTDAKQSKSKTKLPSISALEAEPLVDFEPIRGVSLNSVDRDLSWLNGTRNYSKRNSLISNISLYFRGEDNKEDH